MKRLFISLMLTLTAFIANAQPSAISPRDEEGDRCRLVGKK